MSHTHLLRRLSQMDLIRPAIIGHDEFHVERCTHLPYTRDRKSPSHSDQRTPCLQSAKEYLQKNDSKSALIQLKNVLQKNPDLGEARFLLGSLFLQNGNPTGAEIEFRKALAAKYPESTVVPELARAMLQLDQARKLVDQFGSTQLNQAAADASLQTSLATAYANLGNTEATETAL